MNKTMILFAAVAALAVLGATVMSRSSSDVADAQAPNRAMAYEMAAQG